MRQMPVPPSPAMTAIEQGLLGLLFLALVALSSLPAARAASPVFGWTPLWLLGLPAAALATAFALRLMRRHPSAASQARLRRRRQALSLPVPPRRDTALQARRGRMPRAA